MTRRDPDPQLRVVGGRPRHINDAPNIDWRASRLLALDRPAAEVCGGCGCLLDPPAHSPRCTAA